MKSISGTISLLGIFSCVLLDSGATHSFISMPFGENLGRTPSKLPYILSMSTPIGKTVRVSSCFEECEFLLGRKSLIVDLIPLPMEDFDIILGMDFLATYQELIDCFGKEVTFRFSDREEVKFCGEKKIGECQVISCLKARSLLGKGCEGVWAHVVDTKPTISSI